MRVLVPTMIAVVAMATPPAGRAADQPANWSRPLEPFRILGDVHYVGTEGLSAFLITGPAGHVLIDGALPSSAPLIADSIRKLGFDPRDVKLILVNHSHYDHAGGLAALKRLTGAQLLASAGDRPDLEAGRTIGRTDIAGFPPVKVDRVIRDGERVTLGPISLTAVPTPGHTRGATTWTTVTRGKRIVFASSLSVAGQNLRGDPAYPQAADDFRRTFAKLRTMRADVFVNFHAEGFGLAAKRARLKAGDVDAFVDPSELPRQVDAAERAFRTELERQASTD